MQSQEWRQKFISTNETLLFFVMEPMSILCPCVDNLLKISETVEEWVVLPSDVHGRPAC